jgi:hypothetical protein
MRRSLFLHAGMGLKLRTNSTASQEKKTGAPYYEKHFVFGLVHRPDSK